MDNFHLKEFLNIKNSRSFLDKVLEFWQINYNSYFKFGFELEFELKNESSEIQNIEYLKSSIESIASNNAIPLKGFESEIAENQYEITSKVTTDIIDLCDRYYQLKEILRDSAQLNKLELNLNSITNNFYSNGLHLNFSLWLGEKNLFAKKDGDESKELLFSVAGLLNHAVELCLFCLSDEQDFTRFNEKFELTKEELRHKTNSTYSPSHIAWGGNNRTCLIRIPDINGLPLTTHLEFRLAVPKCDLYLALSALILAMHLGLKLEKLPPAKIYGNAYDKQYELERLPDNSKICFNKLKENFKLIDLIEKINK